MENLKFIFVHYLNDYSGSPRILSRVIRSIGDSNSVVITSNTDGILTNTREIEHHNFAPKGKSLKLIGKIISFVYGEISIFHILYKLRDRIDQDTTIWVNTLLPCLPVFAFNVLKNTKIVVHLHEFTTRNSILDLIANRCINRMARLVIYVSNYHIANYKYRFTLPTLRVLNNTLDYYPNFVKKKPTNEFNVIFVGSNKVYKGINELIELVRRLLAHTSIPIIKFVIVINGQISQSSPLGELANKHSDRVRVFTNLRSLNEIYSIGHVLLNLSDPKIWVETFGLTIMEGMSNGMAVIAPTVGGHLDYVVHYRNGFLVDQSDINTIQNLIIELSQNREFLQSVSNEARETALMYHPDSYRMNVRSILELD